MSKIEGILRNLKDQIFVQSYAEDAEHIAFFDTHGNKYISRGGTLPWRINNPGLVLSHSPVARKNGSIGGYNSYAIFPNPEKGHRALNDWLRLKKHHNSTLKSLAKHYQPNDPDGFTLKLLTLANLPTDQKLNLFSEADFECLARAITKLCGYIAIGNEELSLLPKISGKIENGKDKEDSYLIGSDLVLSKTETIEWIHSFRLDACIVRESKGNIHPRSRPHHTFWRIRRSAQDIPLFSGTKIETLVRTIGEKKPNQCIWGFINGISNTKEKAVRSAELISSATGGEAVLSMPNDTSFFLFDLPICAVLKLNLNTPIVVLAEKFLLYLVALSVQNKIERPVIIFAHSQGAIIGERALERLKEEERNKLRIFTLGGGSFISPEKSHPDSHNYTSAADIICRLGSPHLQILALLKHEGNKIGFRPRITDSRISNERCSIAY